MWGSVISHTITVDYKKHTDVLVIFDRTFSVLHARPFLTCTFLLELCHMHYMQLHPGHMVTVSYDFKRTEDRLMKIIGRKNKHILSFFLVKALS